MDNPSNIIISADSPVEIPNEVSMYNNIIDKDGAIPGGSNNQPTELLNLNQS